MENWSMGLLGTRSQTGTVEAEPQMRRYEVISDKAVEIIEAEDYDHSVEAASYVFTAAGRKVYEVARYRVASIRDLGPAETKEEE